MNPQLERARALTFDLFGTVLDLGGSLTPCIAEFLREHGTDTDASDFWDQLRHRQRVEQYQDSLLDLGHSGYLETVEKAFSYVCRLNGLDPSRQAIERWMESWQMLSPFPDVTARARSPQIPIQTGGPLQWQSVVPGVSRREQETNSMPFSP